MPITGTCTSGLTKYGQCTRCSGNTSRVASNTRVDSLVPSLHFSDDQEGAEEGHAQAGDHTHQGTSPNDPAMLKSNKEEKV